MDVLSLLEQRPTTTQIEALAQKMAKGHWKRITNSERQEFLVLAKSQLREEFMLTPAYKELAWFYLAQEKDFIHTFANRRRRPELVDCSFEDLISLGHIVLLEVLAGHWGSWDHRKGPFQNFFRRALFHRFLTKLSYAGVLKTSAKKRQANITEIHTVGQDQTVSTTTRQVLSLDYQAEGDDQTTSLEDYVSSSDHLALEERQVVADLLSRLPNKRDRQMLQLMLIGLPHTERTKESASVLKEAVLPTLREMGFPVANLTEEPTVCDLLKLTTHGFRYHKRQLAKKVSKLLEIAA